LTAEILTDRKPTTIVRGATDAALFGLSFENSSDGAVLLQNIRLTLRNRAGELLAPNSVLSRLSVVDYDDAEVRYIESLEAPAENPVDVVFPSGFKIEPNTELAMEFRLDILSQTSAEEFRISIDDPQEDVIVKQEGSDIDIQLIDASGNVITTAFSTGLSVLIDNDLQASFYNFPNPFGSSLRSTTTFNYHLNQASDIEIRIYTLLGDHVYTFEFKATDQEGSQGAHSKEIFWDGRNGKGQEVLNGVYIAVLETANATAYTKIAVAR
jgi:hypothetical protein